MRLTSRKVHLSKIIHDWLCPVVSCRIVRLCMYFQQTRPNDGYLVQFCKQYLDRLSACIDAIKVLFTKLDQVTVIGARLRKNA